MTKANSEQARAAKRYRASSRSDLDHRAMGKEIVRADTREPPVLVAAMFSLGP